MNTLFLHDIQIETIIGVFEWERVNPQVLRLDLELSLPNNNACKSDELQDTINYANLVDEIRKVAEKTQRRLIEALAEDIAQFILNNYAVREVKLRLIKRGILSKVGEVGIEIIRKMEN